MQGYKKRPAPTDVGTSLGRWLCRSLSDNDGAAGGGGTDHIDTDGGQCDGGLVSADVADLTTHHVGDDDLGGGILTEANLTVAEGADVEAGIGGLADSLGAANGNGGVWGGVVVNLLPVNAFCGDGDFGVAVVDVAAQLEAEAQIERGAAGGVVGKVAVAIAAERGAGADGAAHGEEIEVIPHLGIGGHVGAVLFPVEDDAAVLNRFACHAVVAGLDGELVGAVVVEVEAIDVVGSTGIVGVVTHADGTASDLGVGCHHGNHEKQSSKDFFHDVGFFCCWLIMMLFRACFCVYS